MSWLELAHVCCWCLSQCSRYCVYCDGHFALPLIAPGFSRRLIVLTWFSASLLLVRSVMVISSIPPDDVFLELVPVLTFCGYSYIILVTLTARGSTLVVRIWRQILTTKVDHRAVIVKIVLIAVAPYLGIQINQKGLTKTFMMISNWKKTHLVAIFSTN